MLNDHTPSSKPSAEPGGSSGSATVTLTVLSAGVVRAPEVFLVPKGGVGLVAFPALFAMVNHPCAGIGLFDTGYSTRFYEATRHFPHRLSRLVTPVRMGPQDNAVSQLAARGVQPDHVRWIVLSHFDSDHLGGLLDFPQAKVTCLRSAWLSVAGKTGFAALRARLLPGLLPPDLADRLTLLDPFQGNPVGCFAASHDLFGDGSVRLVELPGHAPGHVGAIVQSLNHGRVLLAADGCWTRAGMGGALVHRRLATSKTAQDDTYRLLERVRREMPDVIIVPSHCPEAASEFLPNGAWRLGV